MRKFAFAAAMVAAVACTSAAQAKGCIKGALVGGTAGHFAGHHGFLGAAAGCVIGRHEANKRAREQQLRDDGTVRNQRVRPETVGHNPGY
jgi:hypothetical protein